MIIGLGGAALPVFLHAAFPEALITVVEIDPAVVDVAVKCASFHPIAFFHTRGGTCFFFLRSIGEIVQVSYVVQILWFDAASQVARRSGGWSRLRRAVAATYRCAHQLDMDVSFFCHYAHIHTQHTHRVAHLSTTLGPLSQGGHPVWSMSLSCTRTFLSFLSISSTAWLTRWLYKQIVSG